MMKFGCFIALLLLPVTFLIWVEKERRRRAAMPPEELKILEDTEKYGEIHPNIECIYCHKKNCVRAKSFVDFIGSPAQVYTTENLKKNAGWIALSPDRALARMAREELSKTAQMLKAKCMACNSHWNMFDPDAEKES